MNEGEFRIYNKNINFKSWFVYEVSLLFIMTAGSLFFCDYSNELLKKVDRGVEGGEGGYILKIPEVVSIPNEYWGSKRGV